MNGRSSSGIAKAALGGLVLGTLVGCASSGGNSAGESTLTVFAASSLTESFTELGRKFEAGHPGVRVRLSFGASSALAAQIISGASADVFASASPATMAQVLEVRAAVTSQVLARNSMEIAVPPPNPAGVHSVSDLAKPGIKIAVCQPQVPCGSAASEVLTKAALTITPVTLEADVKSVMGKVRLGEVDAGLVYVTDVKAAGNAVSGVPIPPPLNATTSYPISALTQSPEVDQRQADNAAAFVAFVVGEPGQKVLETAGFVRP